MYVYMYVCDVMEVVCVDPSYLLRKAKEMSIWNRKSLNTGTKINIEESS